MKKVQLLLLTLFCLLPFNYAYGVTEITLTNDTYIRGTGAPIVETVSFPAKAGPANITVINGNLEDTEVERVSSSLIALNGKN